jgi:hypothetical protein
LRLRTSPQNGKNFNEIIAETHLRRHIAETGGDSGDRSENVNKIKAV